MATNAWPSLSLVQLADAFDDLVQLVALQPPTQRDGVTRALARFLVVRSSGYVEQVSVVSCRSFLEAKSFVPQARQFSKSWLGYGANPTPENLHQLVRRFDGAWADEFEAFLCA